MKNLNIASKVLLFVLCLGFSVFSRAGDGVDKQKTYSKSYPLSPGDKVSIHNEFGKVNINTWDKNEVKVDVTITITATSDADADYILDHISIEDGKEGSNVHFRTRIDLHDHWSSSHQKNEKYAIDYVVYLPSAQALTLSNNFGATTVPDYNGIIEVSSKFGSLDAGHLASVKSVNVEFGKGNIASVHDGNITIKFSTAEIAELSGNIDASFEFCNSMNLRATSAIRSLSIRNAYTELKLKLATGIPASFDISTHFGSLNNHSDYTIQDETKDTHNYSFRKSYSGKSGDGSVSIRVKGEFSTIDLD